MSLPPVPDDAGLMRVLVVSVEPPWPATHGGRIRTARLAEALGRAGASVKVIAPSDADSQESPPGISVGLLAKSTPSISMNIRCLLTLDPKLGLMNLQAARRQIEQECSEADVVLWSHDYLAAVCDAGSTPSVIDLANVEFLRQRSLATRGPLLRRIPKWIEAIKARWWEPRVWREADAVLVLTPQDEAIVARHGAHAVRAFNGIDPVEQTASPSDGHVLLVGSFSYEPNRAGATWFLDEVWNIVRRVHPSAKVVIAGRGADRVFRDDPSRGVRIVADFDSPAALYRGAAAVAAPVSAGGGSQLKLVEAVAYRRAIVCHEYGRSGLPDGLTNCDQFWFAEAPNDFASALASLLADVTQRHRREQAAWQKGHAPTWDEALSEAVGAVLALGGRR